MIYNERIKFSVLRIFGKDSEVYQALKNGERISKFIKKSYSKKGPYVSRMREKRMLFEECKKIEEEFDKQNQTNVEV